MTSQFAAVVATLIDSEVLAPKSIAQITSTRASGKISAGAPPDSGTKI